MMATIAVLALAASGCTTGQKTSTAVDMAAKGAEPASSMSGGAKSGMKINPDAQNCSACTTGKTPPSMPGIVESLDGKQMMNVTIKNGMYIPNRFTAKAGTPATVAFTVEGKPATACVSKPTFKQLGKTLEITTGSKSIDLGALAPGTYDFTCAMGRPNGQIVVE